MYSVLWSESPHAKLARCCVSRSAPIRWPAQSAFFRLYDSWI